MLLFWVLGFSVEPDSLQGPLKALGKYCWEAFKGGSLEHPKQAIF